MSAPALLAVLAVWSCAAAPQAAGPVRLERRLGAMGTWLDISVEASDRAKALAASEAAARAIEACEARLSTWRDDSELARLNATPLGEAFVLSAELWRDLQAVREVHLLTAGAFDPAVGGLVRAWGLREGGRIPGEAERRAALVPGGFSALRLEGGRASRTHPSLLLEEGGFGKGVGLDEARSALLAHGVRTATVDLGGQVLSLGGDFSWEVAHPLERDVAVLRVRVPEGSLASSGNGERGLVVDGRRMGHLLDPRSGEPARDFGSVTVWAAGATRADALATGLFVLGPEIALQLAQAEALDVLLLEFLQDGSLRARATGRLALGLEVLDPRVRVERAPSDVFPARR